MYRKKKMLIQLKVGFYFYFYFEDGGAYEKARRRESEREAVVKGYPLVLVSVNLHKWASIMECNQMGQKSNLMC